jgi:zinc protease
MKKIFCIIALAAPTLLWAQVDRSIRPKAAEAPAINIKDSEVFKTANGLTVILSENHKVPKVSFDLTMGSDPRLEMNKAGLADLAGSLIMSGTTNRDKDVLDKESDYIGARLAADNNSVYLSCLTKHMDKGLDLMSDVLMNASFPQSEFDRIVKLSESGLKGTKASPGEMAGNALSKSLFAKDHPNSEVMTEESLKNITREDVISYYKGTFTPMGAYLVVVGDIDRAGVEKMVDKYFMKWAGLPEFKNMNMGKNKISGNQVYFVKKPGAVQSVIYVAFPMDIKPGDKDQIALTVLNSIMGGGTFGNRLMQNLREDKAFTYGCRSSMDINEYGSYWAASGNFRNDVTDSAMTEILYEITRITEGYVSDEELSMTKSSMAGAFARSMESPQTVARFALNTKRYNLSKDYYQTYLKRLAAISKEDILTMAQKYFSPKNLNMVVVGSEDVLPNISKFDTDGKITKLDAFGNEAKETKKADITADVLLDKYVLALTNSESLKQATKKMKKVKSYKRVMDLQSAQIPIPLKMTDVWITPNKEGQKMEGQGMTLQRSYFDGKAGGSASMQAGKKALTEEEIAAKQKSQGLIPEMNFKTSGMQYEMVGIEVLDEVDMYVLKTNDGSTESYEYYNTKTFMKAKTVSTSKQGEEVVTSEMSFADYEELNGIMFPRTISLSVGPMTLEGKVSELKINDKIDLGPYSK